MKQRMPKISVIIPTYNRAKYLAKAIESALSQDYSNMEVIVSDNASTDNTAEICKKYKDDERFKYYRNERNVGMVLNWRKALYDYATGDYAIILSDDDYFIDNSYLTKAANLISKYPNVVLVHANYQLLFEENGEIKSINRKLPKVSDGKEYFLRYPYNKKLHFMFCSTIFNRDLAIKLNAFHDNNIISSDLELFLTLCLHGDVGFIDDKVVVYRKHSMSVSSLSTLETYLKNSIYINNVYTHALDVLGKEYEKTLKNWKNKYSIKYFNNVFGTGLLKRDRKEVFNFLKIIYKRKLVPLVFFLDWRVLFKIFLLLLYLDKYYQHIINTYLKIKK